MNQTNKITFSLSTFFNWKVESDDKDWLENNIKEFKSSQKDFSADETYDVSISHDLKININQDAKIVSEGIYCLPDSIYIKDKYSNKKMLFQSKNHSYELHVEKGFTFHYYAALLDAFIKIIAFKKGVVALHASAIKRGGEVSVFGAWRRMGKTTTVLNVLAQDNTIQVLADDAVFISSKGQLIPYLRGIDLYPYLPIPNSYLNSTDKLKRRIASFFQSPSLLSGRLANKVMKRFLLPRINLAMNGHGALIDSIEVSHFYAIKKHLKSETQKNNITASELKSFIGRSSYFEIIEYQAIFEMACSIYPESNFSKLIIDYKTFQEKVNEVISSSSSTLELNLSSDYSDISKLGDILYHNISP